MDTVNKEWNIKVDLITFYKFSVTEVNWSIYADYVRESAERKEDLTAEKAGADRELCRK